MSLKKGRRKHRDYGGIPSDKYHRRSKKSASSEFSRSTEIRKPHKKKSSQKKFTKKTAKQSVRNLLWLFIVGGIGAGVVGIIGVAVISSSLPHPDKLTDRVVAQSTKIYDKDGTQLLYEIFADQKRTIVELEDIPQYAIDATIAIEDKHFFEHKGVRWVSIIRASVNNAIGRRTGSGGASTLTQQLVKNAIVGDDRSYIRKIKEAILATKIEKTFTKNQILKLYFNEIPYGSANYGIESSALAYFGKSASEITLAEAATLAALPKAPTRYLNDTEALLGRRNFILSLMADQEFITEAQAQAATDEPLELSERLTNIEAPHFVLYVKEQLTEKFGEKMVETGGLTVRTSLDYKLQTIAEEEVEKGCEQNAASNEASNASLSAINPRTGEIVAMVGSCDYFNDDIDGQVNVSLRPRQPGSSFKPFVYLTGFQQGYTPNTVLYDAVTNFSASGKDYTPHNYDSKERGPVTARKALQGSLNIPAVKMLYLAGVRNVLDLASKSGYTTLSDPDRYGLSLVLGGAEVKLLEHVSAYATLANQGRYHEPISILEVRDKDGVLFEQKITRGEKAIDEDHVNTLTNILIDDNARAYAFGAGGVLSLPDRPIAAKTGTTNDYRDGWTLGYTPSLAGGVWVGNNDNTPMRRGVGGSVGAGPIWNMFMRRALAGTAIESFPETPKNKTRKPVLNGNDAGGIPVSVDRVSGKLATDDTPEELIEEAIFMQPHSILHYVQKNDPDGSAPSNPDNDSQYSLWEDGVATWIANKQAEAEEAGEELQFVLGDPPTEFDDVHDKKLSPELTVLAPTANGTVFNRIITPSIEVSAPRGVAKVAYLLDDIFIGSAHEYPFSITHEASELENGEHTLTVKAYDDVSNMARVDVNFTLDAIPQPSNISWVSPKKNGTLFGSLFPLTLQMRPFKADNIKKVVVFYHPENDDRARILGTITEIDDVLELEWSETPPAGRIEIKPQIHQKRGGIVWGTPSTITVRE